MTNTQAEVLKRLIMNQPLVEPNPADLEVLQTLQMIVPTGYAITPLGREVLARWVNDQIPPLPVGSYGGRA